MPPSVPSPLLVIDASSKVGSLALFRGGSLLATATVAMGRSAGDPLFVAVASLLRVHGVAPGSLAAVACGAGPGGFTSLRMAASVAKGLLSGGAGVLYGVPSLGLAAAAVALPVGDVERTLLVHADALRGERFVQRFAVGPQGTVRALGPVARVPHTALDGGAAADGGVRSWRVAVEASPTPELEDAICLPDAGRALAVAGWLDAGPVSIAGWEPDYGRLAEAQVQWEQRHGRALDPISR
jgi:tRNA threonylcarbamoyladenosine biosynthesis protein TsaB